MSYRLKFWWALSATVLLALAGCRVNSINYFPPHPASVRVINLMPDVGALNVLVDTSPAFTGVAPQSATGYQSFENKVTTFAVTIPGVTTNLLEFTYSLAGDQPYTLVLSGDAAAPVAKLLQEANSTNSGNGQFSILNSAVTTTFVDVYVTAPDADITTLKPNFGGLAYNGNALIQTFPAGVYAVRVTPSGSKGIIYDSGPQSLTGNAAVTVLIYSRGSGDLVTALFLQSHGTATFVDGNTTRLKVVNAAALTGNVDQYLGAQVIAANVAYGTPTDYNQVPAGTHAINFQASATPGAIIASVTSTLLAAGDQTVVITGYPGALQAFVLADLNVRPPAGTVRVRFVNTSPDAGPLNVVINGAVAVAGLASPTASGYVPLVAGTYGIVFNNAAGQPVLSLPPVVLTAGQTSTVYVTGPASQLTAVVTQDD